MQCALVLADGAVYHGEPFGAPPPLLSDLEDLKPAALHTLLQGAGEVVFNTAMSGYPEVLTDPSYTGQIVVMTSPHMGNYGISPEWAESDPRGGRPVTVAGFIVRDSHEGPVDGGRTTLQSYLSAHGIPGITGVDTRALTLDLRDSGVRNGLICRNPQGTTLSEEEVHRALAVLQSFPSMEGRSLINLVGTREVHTTGGTGGPHVALYDCGIKQGIIRELQRRGCTISLVPAGATAEEILATGARAVLLSNGPGDPAVLAFQVEQTRALLGAVPLLGICLGHQIIAEAMGARTFKMPFGHHGVNHPVREEVLPPRQKRRGRVFVTSQNHGFAVDEATIPRGTRVWFRNANDQTVEGLWNDKPAVRTAQFHPESAPGPHDSSWIFDAFLEVI